jgi:hypothetical protein
MIYEDYQRFTLVQTTRLETSLYYLMLLLLIIQSHQGCFASLFPPIREIVGAALSVGGSASTTTTRTTEAGTGTNKRCLLKSTTGRTRSIAGFDQKPTATAATA